MTPEEYLDKRGQLELKVNGLKLQMQELDREYRANFPGIGDTVFYKGKEYVIHWIETQPYLDLHYILKDKVTDVHIDVKFSELDSEKA